MPDLREGALVSTDWLARHQSAPDIRLVDATWFLPADGRDAKAEHAAAHIPSAVYFDIDAIADDASPLPHMAPSAAKFAARVRKLGLGDGTRIVAYDDNNFFASARVWWLFRLMGHQDVGVLDGGLAKWRAEGGAVTDEPTLPQERHFTVRRDNLLVRDLDQVRRNLTARREQVVDARSPGRFTGAEPEPRPRMRSGHIPNSANLHYRRLIAKDGTLMPGDDLAAAFQDAGVDVKRPIVTTCGSGVSAAVLNLALFTLGRRHTALFDGSWSEWGAKDDTPVATG